MIIYLVTAQHDYTITPFLRSWDQAIAPEVAVIPYAALPGYRDLPAGTYIFSDLERLTPVQRPLVVRLWEQLARAGPAVRLLNHPERSLRRYDLLRCLNAAGRNRFNAYRPSEPGRPWRYPVFVRHEHEHGGSLTQPLPDLPTLRHALAVLVMDGYHPRDLLVVEFCDTKDNEGLYCKYAAFRIGERIVTNHLVISRSWVVKAPADYIDVMTPVQLDEYKRYRATNPHERELRAIFEMAKIEYGRVDYSLLDGAIQVWEINTNPVVMRPPHEYTTFGCAVRKPFVDECGVAFAQINAPSSGLPRIPVTWTMSDLTVS